MGLFDLFKKQNETLIEEDVMFEHILNVFFKFKDKYPDKVVSIQISPSRTMTDNVAFDIVFILDGNIKYYVSNETNEMLEYFELIENDVSFMTFRCIHNTFESSSSRAYTEAKLKSFVKHFTTTNPTRNFDLSKSGASITFW